MSEPNAGRRERIVAYCAMARDLSRRGILHQNAMHGDRPELAIALDADSMNAFADGTLTENAWLRNFRLKRMRDRHPKAMAKLVAEHLDGSNLGELAANLQPARGETVTPGVLLNRALRRWIRTFWKGRIQLEAQQDRRTQKPKKIVIHLAET